SIMADEKLPLETRQQQVTSMMSLMLARDIRTPVELAVSSGMFNALPAEDLAKLQGQINESRNRTEVQDNMGLLDQYAQLQARQQLYGDVDPKTFSQLQQEMVN
ncbi:hypothetical protein, partial [Staphylococcus aureus]|uniref:hypothetical protein n=1 Tax=Staphylococcus aureus TaxID=1280 RepID=UPI00301E4FEA